MIGWVGGGECLVRPLKNTGCSGLAEAKVTTHSPAVRRR